MFLPKVMYIVVKMVKLFIIQMRLLASSADGCNDNNTIITIIKIIIISTIMMTINTEQLIRKRLCRY